VCDDIIGGGLVRQHDTSLFSVSHEWDGERRGYTVVRRPSVDLVQKL
jgi:hypothetical protein